LLHGKRSIAWWRKVREKGYTLIPLSLYEKRGRVKVELALVHGKQQYDRREDVRSAKPSAKWIAPCHADEARQHRVDRGSS